MYQAFVNFSNLLTGSMFLLPFCDCFFYTFGVKNESNTKWFFNKSFFYQFEALS